MDATDIAFSPQSTYRLPNSRAVLEQKLIVIILDTDLTTSSFFNFVARCGTVAAARSTQSAGGNLWAHYVEFKHWSNAYRCHTIAFWAGYNVALLCVAYS